VLTLRNQKGKDHCVSSSSVRIFCNGGKVPVTQLVTFLVCVFYFSADISQTAEIFKTRYMVYKTSKFDQFHLKTNEHILLNALNVFMHRYSIYTSADGTTDGTVKKKGLKLRVKLL
jgi:hypothetical protein